MAVAGGSGLSGSVAVVVAGGSGLSGSVAGW
jgi:hypothetical protein